ncbi:MAG: LamG domain-containing protein [Candidatus Aenigmarchaeota archaeon]|nr:LamG domain-containing protein [Candidatus Aenigmarchaeota archaeon]
MKAVTPIVAIIAVLLIAVAMAGLVYSYLSAYSDVFTGKKIGIVERPFCFGGTANIFVQNIGTKPIDIPQAIAKEPSLKMHYSFESGFEGAAKDDSGSGNDGLIFGSTLAALSMDEAPGSEYVNDTSNYNHDGILGSLAGADPNDPARKTGMDCISGGCLEFDGVDDYVNLGLNSNLNISGQMSVFAWAKRNDDMPSERIIGRYYRNPQLNQPNGSWVLDANTYGNNETICYFNNGTTWIPSFSQWNAFSKGTWHQVGCVYNWTHLINYVDGIQYNTTPMKGSMPTNNTFPITIGTSSNGTDLQAGDFFNGTMDEVAIYNRSLTAADVRDLYNSRTAKFIEWAGAHAGKGLDFDGLDDYVDLPPATSLGITNSNFTAEAWIKADSWSTSDNAILGTDKQASNEGLQLIIRNNMPYMDFYGNSQTGSTQLLPNKWYHMAWRYTLPTGEQAIFVDGKLDGSSTGHAAFQGIENVRLGRWAGRFNFDGVIDEVAIYNRALSAAEIGEHAQACRGSGNEYICGELTVRRTSGSGTFYPQFNNRTIDPGAVALLQDTGCRGSCEYRILSASGAEAASVRC